jgi:hypothetical protein
MNRLVLIGLILVALGAVGLVVPRITYQEEAASVNIGPLDLQVTQERSITIPDILAGAFLVAGGVLIAIGSQRSSK